jgi:hypothetical protein
MSLANDAITTINPLTEAQENDEWDGGFSRFFAYDAGSAQCGQPALEPSFSMAFQRLEFSTGNVGIALWGDETRRWAGGRVLQNERFLKMRSLGQPLQPWLSLARYFADRCR